MPNYEELYYITKNKYNQAIINRDTIRRNRSALQGRKNTLLHELEERRITLNSLKQKVTILQDAENKCSSIINNEFPDMKKYIQETSDEYKKIINSDNGVADIQSVYSSDIQSTQNDLNSILSDLSQKRKNLEDQVDAAQQSFDNCNNELNTVTNQLNNVGSEYDAQRQVNNYYTQMQVYKTKWLNGEWRGDDIKCQQSH